LVVYKNSGTIVVPTNSLDSLETGVAARPVAAGVQA